MFKIIKEERANRILTIIDWFEPEGIRSITDYAESVEKSDIYMTNYKVKISYDNYVKWLVNECDYSEEEAREDADEWVEENKE